MAKEIPSVGDLRRKSEVTDEEIAAATTAYLKDENAEPFAFKSGHTIDVAKAIEMHPQAKKLLAEGGHHVGAAAHDGDDRRHHGLSGSGMSRLNHPLIAYSSGEGSLTVSDLRKAAQVTDGEITAPVNAALADCVTDPYVFSNGWTLDLAQIVLKSDLVAMALKSDQPQWKRGVVRRVILSSHPLKA